MDDFYGALTFKIIQKYLLNTKDSMDFYEYPMAGFILKNALTDHSCVARGVCCVDKLGYLTSIKERT